MNKNMVTKMDRKKTVISILHKHVQLWNLLQVLHSHMLNGKKGLTKVGGISATRCVLQSFPGACRKTKKNFIPEQVRQRFYDITVLIYKHNLKGYIQGYESVLNFSRNSFKYKITAC